MFLTNSNNNLFPSLIEIFLSYISISIKYPKFSTLSNDISNKSSYINESLIFFTSHILLILTPFNIFIVAFKFDISVSYSTICVSDSESPKYIFL